MALVGGNTDVQFQSEELADVGNGRNHLAGLLPCSAVLASCGCSDRLVNYTDTKHVWLFLCALPWMESCITFLVGRLDLCCICMFHTIAGIRQPHILVPLILPATAQSPSAMKVK